MHGRRCKISGPPAAEPGPEKSPQRKPVQPGQDAHPEHDLRQRAEYDVTEPVRQQEKRPDVPLQPQQQQQLHGEEAPRRLLRPLSPCQRAQLSNQREGPQRFVGQPRKSIGIR